MKPLNGVGAALIATSATESVAAADEGVSDRGAAALKAEAAGKAILGNEVGAPASDGSDGVDRAGKPNGDGAPEAAVIGANGSPNLGSESAGAARGRAGRALGAEKLGNDTGGRIIDGRLVAGDGAAANGETPSPFPKGRGAGTGRGADANGVGETGFLSGALLMPNAGRLMVFFPGGSLGLFARAKSDRLLLLAGVSFTESTSAGKGVESAPSSGNGSVTNGFSFSFSEAKRSSSDAAAADADTAFSAAGADCPFNGTAAEPWLAVMVDFTSGIKATGKG